MSGICRAMRLAKGHVYLIAPEGTPKNWRNGKGKLPVKIGVSKSENGVYNRLKDLSSGNWEKLVVDYISPEISQPYNVEWFLHTRLAKCKLRGEWFDLSLVDYKDIIRLLDKEPNVSNTMGNWGYTGDTSLIQYHWTE